MDTQQRIEAFLGGEPHVVVGASRDRSKYGNKVLRAYLQAGRPVVAVNPYADSIEGVVSYPRLADVPGEIHGISVITPPEVTEEIVAQAADRGIRHLWLQPGAENERALARGAELGLEVIAGGPCALVVLGFREST